MALFRQFTKIRPAWQSALYSAQAAPATNAFYDVPEGHASSDLSPSACNIGLNRRRELTLGAAANIKLTIDGKPQRLADLFERSTKAVIFGVPDCGKVCSEKHLPGYLKEFDNIRQQGVDKIFCVVAGDPAAADAWAKKQKVDASKVIVAADANGGLTRMLGVEMGDINGPGARSQRYAGIIAEGVLLKFKVEKSPGDLKETSAESMVELLKACN